VSPVAGFRNFHRGSFLVTVRLVPYPEKGLQECLLEDSETLLYCPTFPFVYGPRIFAGSPCGAVTRGRDCCFVCFTSVLRVSFFVHQFFPRWVGLSGRCSTENCSNSFAQRDATKVTRVAERSSVGLIKTREGGDQCICGECHQAREGAGFSVTTLSALNELIEIQTLCEGTLCGEKEPEKVVSQTGVRSERELTPSESIASK